MRAVRGTMLVLSVLLVAPVTAVQASRVVMQQSGPVTAVHSGGHALDVGGHRYKLAPGLQVHGEAGSTAKLSPGALQPGMRIGYDTTGGRHPVITEIWVQPPERR
ncbi:MAG: hypothetical protein ACYC18_05775 [Gammaproteobacteria bacterium]